MYLLVELVLFLCAGKKHQNKVTENATKQEQ